VSGETHDEEIDLRAVTDGEQVGSGVPGGEALTAFADAVVQSDAAAVAAAREEVRRTLGDAAMVDAAGVIANFERMVRIADGTGIPLDKPVAMVSADLREELGIDDYEGSERTAPVRGLERVAGRLMSRMMPLVLRVFRRS
jgi:hypothetical protein